METLGTIVTVVFILLVVCVLLAFPTMLLWNWLMPSIFHLREIGFSEALGINLLSSILFKSSKD